MVRVEHRDRLVGQQNRSLDCQRAREQHARALADREPAHAARRELERVRLLHRRRHGRGVGGVLACPYARCGNRPSATSSRARERPMHRRVLRQVRDRARARPAVELRERRAPASVTRRGATTRPASARSSVLLPAPFGPTSATSSARLERERRRVARPCASRSGPRRSRPRASWRLTPRAPSCASRDAGRTARRAAPSRRRA